MGRVTQSQIAQQVNVDRTTVSKILNGYQTEHFSPGIVKKVKEAALGLGYRHHKRSWEICAILPFPEGDLKIHSDSYRILEAIMGINNALSGTSCSFHIVKLDKDFDFKSKRADGYLIWEVLSEECRKYLSDSKIPHLVLNRIPQNYKGFCVFHDDNVDFKIAIKYLLKANHKKIALIADIPNVEEKNYWEIENGVFGKNNLDACELSFFNFSSSSDEDMIKFLEEQKITAIIANDDTIGNKIIKLLYDAEKKIPDDYSLIVNNYIAIHYPGALKITGIKTLWEKIAFRGTEILLSNISQKTSNTKPVHEMIKSKLIEGNSVKVI